MRDYVDTLSEELIARYKLHLETFMVDLWSSAGMIEFRVGFALRSEHKLHGFTLKVGAEEAITPAERRAVIDAVFLEIEDQLDEAISSNLLELN
ncbi:hypothetical protein VW35_00330 [Devosia soli]|uniref:Uncharacterized protein n=1 Tax=Devosia soli TaxID=361041 RepID=A0A0F5LJR0_9HYPH|nr:hypothetical protein VW35_00330 [Devosia soli]